MSEELYATFFTGQALACLRRAIALALDEDGPDLTGLAVFPPEARMRARLRAKAPTVVAGLPICREVLAAVDPEGGWHFSPQAEDGDAVVAGTTLAVIDGPARTLLQAERIMLNFLCRLSGIAQLTRTYVTALAGSRTRLLDTRKTAPGLRYPDKYAVRCGGGLNHRLNLTQMLMLKDTHIDQAGSITKAVAALRAAYDPCPPIEVECRNLSEVAEAVAVSPSRVMLDNMDGATITAALGLIPAGIETEISGGVSLETLPALGRLGADFVSVGRITHSAPTADISMQIVKD
jgi:nicotinate-nucleotide pyrophosphorylase (carboxylating)